MKSSPISYRSELARAMEALGTKQGSVFIGQAIMFEGTAMSRSFSSVPREKLIEAPVEEELQLGISLGLAMSGFTPVSVFPRWNFLLLAWNQLVNHLDKASEIFNLPIPPKVIIRTSIGASDPLNPGPQHVGDFSKATALMAPNLRILTLDSAEEVFPAYLDAFERTDGVSTILVEHGGILD